MFGLGSANADQLPPSPPPAPSPAASLAPQASPVPLAPASPTPPLFQLHGEADLGFTGVDPKATLKFTNGVNARVFDNVPNAPDLQNLYLAGTLTDGHFGGEFDLSAGTNADVLHSFDQTTSGFDVTQAYLSYAHGPITVQAGKFTTMAGAEYIRSSQDNQYSRSILFGYAIPFTHTGVRLTYAPDPKLSVVLGENLGWDQFRQTSGNATWEGAIIFDPSPGINFSVQTYNGNENDTLVPIVSPAVGHRTLYDSVLTLKPTDALTLAANYDYASQTNAPLLNGTGALVSPSGVARWGGLAEYITYAFTPKWSATLRGESFFDAGGYRTGFDQRWREGTITAQYDPSSKLVLRAEYRNDISSSSVFARTNGTSATTLGTFGLEALVKY